MWGGGKWGAVACLGGAGRVSDVRGFGGEGGGGATGGRATHLGGIVSTEQIVASAL